MGRGRAAAWPAADGAGAQVSGGHEDRGHRRRYGQNTRRGETPHPPRHEPPPRGVGGVEARGMSTPVDPELDDVLQDSELLHLAHLLSSVRPPEPRLDD